MRSGVYCTVLYVRGHQQVCVRLAGQCISTLPVVVDVQVRRACFRYVCATTNALEDEGGCFGCA